MKKSLFAVAMCLSSYGFSQTESRIVELEAYGSNEKIVTTVHFTGVDVIENMDVIIFEDGVITTPTGIIVGLVSGLGAGAQVFTGNGPIFFRANVEG